MKTRFTFATALSVLGLAIALTAPTAAQNGNGYGNGRGPGPGVPVTVEPVTDAEAKSLAYMREEEKLARDVYTALAEKWKLTVFANIAKSEDRHFDAIGNLLARYNVLDPAATDTPGSFVNADLKKLYEDLVKKGMTSAKDAIEVGIAIETLDIKDLEEDLKATTKADIKRVYTNLLAGSYDHLEAFQTCQEILQAVQ